MGPMPQKNTRHAARRYRTRRRAATAVEYAALIALLIIVAVGAILAIGANTRSAYSNFSSAMPHVLSQTDPPVGTAEGPQGPQGPQGPVYVVGQ
jgi:Flp pilus assembly pilin Flp